MYAIGKFFEVDINQILKMRIDFLEYILCQKIKQEGIKTFLEKIEVIFG